ncbi:MAG: hypothetical protein NTX45_08765 [Proteobacteria bacterium]|nr:hypothetical protein [Pseudomonadota bacterium]
MSQCRSLSFRQGCRNPASKDGSLRVVTHSELDTRRFDKLPSMALDSGIPAGMTVFSGLTGLVYNGERWILGTSDDTGRYKVVQQPFPAFWAMFAGNARQGGLIPAYNARSQALALVVIHKCKRPVIPAWTAGIQSQGCESMGWQLT